LAASLGPLSDGAGFGRANVTAVEFQRSSNSRESGFRGSRLRRPGRRRGERGLRLWHAAPMRCSSPSFQSNRRVPPPRRESRTPPPSYERHDRIRTSRFPKSGHIRRGRASNLAPWFVETKFSSLRLTCRPRPQRSHSQRRCSRRSRHGVPPFALRLRRRDDFAASWRFPARRCGKYDMAGEARGVVHTGR